MPESYTRAQLADYLDGVATMLDLLPNVEVRLPGDLELRFCYWQGEQVFPCFCRPDVFRRGDKGRTMPVPDLVAGLHTVAETLRSGSIIGA